MKKIYYILIALITLLVITNPSVKAFKEFLGIDSYNGLSRKSNYLVCSLFSNKGVDYFGIVDNFYKIKHNVDSAEFNHQILQDEADSSAMESDSSMHGRFSYKTFAKRIKNRFPVYNDVDDKRLIKAVIFKYPEFKNAVDTSH